MSSPSNLYAEKVFSEHPVALWPLDDTADYISLISENQRDLRVWDIAGGTAESVTEILDEPFPLSKVSLISSSVVSDDTFNLTCVSPDIMSINSLNKELSTISIGAFIYSNTPYILGFDIGYEYFDSVSGAKVEDLKFFSTDIYQNWIFLSETFTPPFQNSTIRLVIRARFYGGDFPENYSFLVNGISFGQWSEEFNSTSLGVTPVEIPSEILGPGKFGVPAKAYGLQEADGYYIVKDNSLSAKNYGMPMVYGASNTTTLQPSTADPGLVVPGFGFLSESGKYKEYTFEFWLRLISDAVSDTKIFGPLGTEDGLYVSGPWIRLMVGSHVLTHYVGQWFRPMLVHIRYSESSISLVINGEQVAEKSIDSRSLSLSNTEWLGFWATWDVLPVEIDAIAIYGYKVPVQVAKRRFVYGQGVEFPENINNSYSGSSIFIDYPFAKAYKNYSYPYIGRWSQGAYDNLSTSSNVLSFPKYSKPEVLFDNKTTDEWKEAVSSLASANDFGFSLKPNSQWNNSNGFIYVENLSLATEPVKAIYVKCKEVSPSIGKQTIFSVEDRVSGSSFEVVLDNDSIDYIINDGQSSYIIESKKRYYLGETFIVGVDIDKFCNYYGGLAAQFFGRISSMSLYVGGKKNFSQTFSGIIYSIGVCSAKNLSKVSSVFSYDGTVLSDEFVDGNMGPSVADAGTDLYPSAIFKFIYDGGTFGEYADLELMHHVASYNISLGSSLAGTDLCVGGDLYWQDYIPLSTFAKNVTDSRGDDKLDLDFLQFNIDYPAPSKFVKDETTGSWSYEELASEFSNPVQRGYDSLDNQLFTGYESYEDLKNRARNVYKYDTSSSVIKTYVTFQLMEDGANRSSSSYPNTVLAPKEGILIPGDEWINTKYEVVDNMIIYPPSSMSFEKLAIVTHIEGQTYDMSNNMVAIRSLEYSGLSLLDSSPTAIGTRFGNDVFPYQKDGLYFTYKNRNPFTIYKGSTPYLYMTRNSGITIKGQYDPQINRGIAIPVNQSRSDNYKVIALQMSVRFDQDFFPYAPTQIFELQSKNSYIKFFMVATHPSGKRAKIYAVNSRGQLENGLAFYLNGKLVKDPTITIKEWSMLGIRFANTQDFTEYEGAIRLNGPLTFNSLSYYKSTSLQEDQTVLQRPWFKVEKAGPLTLDWNYWNSVPYLWQEVLIISISSYYGVDPSDIYKAYTGTNKIIVDDEVQTIFGDYSYVTYKDVSWRSNVYQAV